MFFATGIRPRPTSRVSIYEIFPNFYQQIANMFESAIIIWELLDSSWPRTRSRAGNGITVQVIMGEVWSRIPRGVTGAARHSC